MSTMRVWAYHSFGPAADVLRREERPLPRPERGEILVRLRTSGLNPHDTKRRSGWLGGSVPEGGVIPHGDGAGEVAAVGLDVSGFTIGDRVMVFGVGHGRIGGTAADYVSVPVEHAIALPDGIDDETGAALGIPAVTACYAVLSAGPVTDRWVLVHGGLGAVGRAAVEVAAWSGARVIATLSDPARTGELHALGASYVLDRHRDDIPAEVARLTKGHGVDLIVDVDFGANVVIDGACVAENGRVASYSSTSNRTPVLPYYDFAMKGARLHFVQGINIPPADALAAGAVIRTLLQRGGLRPIIAHRLPLSDIARGHTLLETGEARGKIIYSIE